MSHACRTIGSWLAGVVLLMVGVVCAGEAGPLAGVPAGFVRVESAGTNLLMAMVFEGFAAGTAGSVASTGTVAIVRWDPSLMQYRTDEGQPAVGEGFWVGATNGSSYILGRVGMDEQKALVLYPGLNLVGYPYPVRAPVPEALAGLVTDQSGTTATNLDAGRGYWVSLGGSNVWEWVERRPYEDVFGIHVLPAITNLSVSGDGAAMRLGIACGAEERAVTVLYQDLQADRPFESMGGWKVAERGVAAAGAGGAVWEDRGSADRAAIGNVQGRYYLVLSGTDASAANNVEGLFVHGNAVGSGTGGAGTGAGGAGGQPAAGQTPDTVGLPDAASSNAVAATRRVPVWRMDGVIYVDGRSGDDTFSGIEVVVRGGDGNGGGTGDGPKRTIAGGLAGAQEKGARRMVILDGTYGEDLNIAGRELSVVVQGKVNLSGRIDRPRQAGTGNVVSNAVVR